MKKEKYIAKIVTKESGEKLLTVKILKRDFSMAGFPLFLKKYFPVDARIIKEEKILHHPKGKETLHVVEVEDEWFSRRLQNISIEGDWEAEEILTWVGRGDNYRIGITEDNKIFYLYLYDNKKDLFFGDPDYETALYKLKEWIRLSKEHNTIDHIRIISNDGRDR